MIAGAPAAAADAVAIIVFAVAGLLSHTHTVSAAGLARDALPILGGWFAAAVLLGLYRRREPVRLLATWALGVSAGVVVRAAILGRTDLGGEAAFLGVTLVATLVLVLVLRLAVRLAAGAARTG